MTISNHFDDPELGGLVLNVADVSELADAEARVELQQLLDGLTGLPNRRLATDRLMKVLDRQRRNGGHVAVIVFDLVRLGFVNETLGHAAGDALLCEVADRLRKAARPGDTVARLDGDDFVVIADGIEEQRDIVALLTRMRAAITKPCTVADLWVVPDVNVGIASTDGSEAPGPDTMLRRAEGAMRQAKVRN